MVFKTTRLENSILSILYHAAALVKRDWMTVDEIIERMNIAREAQVVMWNLKTMLDHGIVEKCETGWKVTAKGASHWNKLCGTRPSNL